MCTYKSEKQRRTNFIEMSSEAHGTLLDLECCDPTAVEISQLKTDLEDLTHTHNRISRVMKMSLFANIVFGLTCVVLLLSLFLCEIKEKSTDSDISLSRGQDRSKTSTQSELQDHFYAVSVLY